MHEEIPFYNKYGDLSAKIYISGNADSVDISMARGGYHRTINRNYGFIEGIWDMLYYDDLGSEHHKLYPQLWFETRIHIIIRRYSNKAKEYVHKDEIKYEKQLEEKKSITQRHDELVSFIGNIKKEIKKGDKHDNKN